MNNPSSQPSAPVFSAFLPVLLLTLGVAIVLIWNLWIALNQHSAGVQIRARQDVQIQQAAQLEGKLRAMMGDLVDLARTDTDAAAIVKRYRIAFSPPDRSVPPVPTPSTKAAAP